MKKRTFARGWTVLLIVASASGQTRALENGLARTPPMGWNSWNTFRGNITEDLILSTARAMVDNGMRDAGYRYINLDDNWMSGRDASGDYLADPSRFPHGMRWLADSVHALSLRIGLYSSNGSSTCMGLPGGLGHEAQDAGKLAQWAIDYYKYDNCGGGARQMNYVTMRNALLACGQPIVFSICEWGATQPWEWGDTVGNLWRVGGDIDLQGSLWTGVLYELDIASLHSAAGGPGGWNDADMMVVGMGMSAAEDRAHFSLWCMIPSPLIVGADLRALAPATLAVLTNGDAIAVNQDSLGAPGRKVADDGDHEVYVKRMNDSSRVVLLFNRGPAAATMSFTWMNAGLPSNESCVVRDLWAHQDLGSLTGSYSTSVPPHDVVMLRLLRGPDKSPPVVLSVKAAATTALVTFSEPVERTTAQNVTNYRVDEGISVSSAVLQPDLTSVLLTTSTLSAGVTYTLTVNNVRDRASAPNTIASDTKAAFQINQGITRIRYYPRSDYPSRMVGGVFEGTNGDQTTGPYTVLYIVPAEPPVGVWTEVPSSSFATAQDFRCVRYRSPESGWCNVGEIEFYLINTKVQGTVFGSPGSFYNGGNDYTKAFDGRTETFMDFSTADGGFAGMCMSSATSVNTAVTHRGSPDARPIRILSRAGTTRLFAKEAGAHRVAVMNTRGQCIATFADTGPASHEIAPGSLRHGVYLVKVSADDASSARPAPTTDSATH